MRKRRLLGVLCLLTSSLVAVGAACADSAMPPHVMVQRIEAAHAGGEFASTPAVQADFALDFGGFKAEGTMLLTPSMDRVRMTMADGSVIVFDGTTAWLSPADAKLPGPPARFHVLTWPYFLAVPYKLDDPGTNHEYVEALPVRSNEKLPGVKVTFDAGVGDAPDDWYIAFPDPDTGRLTALGYIVTYGKTKEEAEKNPSIILYDDFIDVDGVPFATTWTFAHWDAERGVHQPPKATGKLSNIRFVNPDADAFTKPENASEATAPGAAE